MTETDDSTITAGTKIIEVYVNIASSVNFINCNIAIKSYCDSNYDLVFAREPEEKKKEISEWIKNKKKPAWRGQK